jgi:hypothetical protein
MVAAGAELKFEFITELEEPTLEPHAQRNSAAMAPARVCKDPSQLIDRCFMSSSYGQLRFPITPVRVRHKPGKTAGPL